ncbi:MAG: AhpC/TSA family protein [Prevotella sp.]|nr:AhpC/TSA family protein [Prevotella sp.]
MRKSFLALCIAATSVSFAQGTYNINGQYTVPDGKEVFLVNLLNKDTLTVTTVGNGQFSFTGELPEPIYAYVGNGKERVHLILEPGTVAIDLDNRTSHGTPLADAYMAFHRRFYSYDALRNDERKALTGIKETISLNEFNQRWQQLDDKYRRLQGILTDSIVRVNSDNLLGAMALDDLALRDSAVFLRLYAGMTPKMQAVPFLYKDFDNIRLQSRTAPGKMFIDYQIKGGNLDGTDVSLSDYVGKGKYILLDHWASWCGPCKAEMPYIKKTWETFAGEKFDVVSIAVNDKRDKTLQALSQLDMPWHQIVDAQDIPTKAYNILAIPRVILFAPDGTILKNGLRGEQIFSTVSEILAQ